MILKWMDKEEIIMGSSKHDEWRELGKSKALNLVEKASVVLDYKSKIVACRFER